MHVCTRKRNGCFCSRRIQKTPRSESRFLTHGGIRSVKRQSGTCAGQCIRFISPMTYHFRKFGFGEGKCEGNPFRQMVSQWGNCRPSRKILTFNTRLLAAPVRCIEYVVIHEFTHFLYPNHSRGFYDFIAAELPDWKKLQETLQKFVQTRDFT